MADLSESGIGSLKKIAKGGTVLLTGAVLSKIFGLLYVVALARFLGKVDFGVVSLGMAVLNVVVIVVLMGMDAGIIRYISFHRARGEDDKARGILRSGILISLPLALVLSLALGLGADYISSSIFNEPGLAPVLIVLAISLPFWALGQIFSDGFMGLQRVREKVSTWDVLLPLSRLGLASGFVLAGFGAVGAAGGILASYALTLMAAVWLMGRLFPLRGASSDMGRELLIFSIPLLITTVFPLVYGYVDTLFLGYFMGSGDVGLYSAALPVARLMLFVIGVLGMLNPVLSELFSRGLKKEMIGVYKSITKWTFYINLPVLLMMSLFSREVLAIFGPEFVEAWPVLIILACAFFLRSIVMAPVTMLYVVRRTWILVLNTAVALATNIALNIMLIPVYGISGAALATAASLALISMMVLIEAWVYVRASPFSSGFARASLAGAMALLPVWYLSGVLGTLPFPLWLILCALHAALYALMLALLRGFNSEDLEMVQSLERRSGFGFGPLSGLMRKLGRIED